jgi:hypothetical protein
MSVKNEVEELVKWISELSAPEKPAPATEHLYREQWLTIDENLRDAAKKLQDAKLKLTPDPQDSSKPHTSAVQSELALDLQRQAEGLALRAHMLSRRAKPRPKPAAAAKQAEAAAKVKPPTDEQDPPPKLTAEAKAKAKAKADAEAKAAEAKAKATPAELVTSALRTIETANAKLLALQHPDAATKAFEAELDVLAEMTLSLRQRCALPGETFDAGDVG